jgi:single-strand DNA-binding protein
MSFDVQGRMHEIFDEAQVSDKFRKREFVLEIPDGSYTQYIKFQLTQDKCNLLDQFKTGDEVKVTFNLSGKPFTKNGTTMYFTNLSAWRIESATAGAPPANAGNNNGNFRAAASPQPAASSFLTDEADNDLPF